MARFDVHRTGKGRYVLDVQADLQTTLATRVVVPLVPPGTMLVPLKSLHPLLPFAGMTYVMATHLMAAVPCSRLGPPIGTLTHHWDEITRALDMLFTGF